MRDIKERKAIPVTGHGSLQVCRMLRIPRCVYNRLTDGGNVSLTHRPRCTQTETFLFLCPMTTRHPPLSAKIGTKFRRQVEVDQSIYFAYELKATEFVCFVAYLFLSEPQ
jgi:hypothetical protein